MKVSNLTRRDWLTRCGVASVIYSWGNLLSQSENLVSATSAVDHLLLGAADLDRGIAWVEKLTGVKATMGGSHPGVGTRNALLSLGGRRYLELVAPDPAQSAYNFLIDVRKLAEPRLITWAAATVDINSSTKNAREGGYQIFGPREGSRARPDGTVLKWKTLGVLNQFGLEGVEPIPFFIEWAVGSPHPSKDSPKGCELDSFVIEHPNVDGLMAALKKLGVEAKVNPSKTARLRARLKTPKGSVELT